MNGAAAIMVELLTDADGHTYEARRVAAGGLVVTLRELYSVTPAGELVAELSPRLAATA